MNSWQSPTLKSLLIVKRKSADLGALSERNKALDSICLVCFTKQPSSIFFKMEAKKRRKKKKDTSRTYQLFTLSQEEGSQTQPWCVSPHPPGTFASLSFTLGSKGRNMQERPAGSPLPGAPLSTSSHTGSWPLHALQERPSYFCAAWAGAESQGS